MDENKRKIAPNALDICLILVLLVVLAAIGVRYFTVRPHFSPDEAREAQVSFLIRNADAALDLSLEVGEELRLAVGGRNIGTISEPLTRYPTGNSDGEVRHRGAFLANGIETESGFYVMGALYLAPGQTISVQSRGCDFILEILGIDPR